LKIIAIQKWHKKSPAFLAEDFKWGFLKKLPASCLDFSQETGAQQAR
jgi:hypothetical protein